MLPVNPVFWLKQSIFLANHPSTDQHLLQFFRPFKTKIAGGGADVFLTSMPIEEKAFFPKKKLT